MPVGVSPVCLSRKKSKYPERGNTNRMGDFSFAEFRTIESRVPRTVQGAVVPKRTGFLFLGSFTNDLYQDTFAAFSIKFTVKNFLPWPEIQLSTSDGNDNLSSHDRALQMSICIIFSSVVRILGMGKFRSEVF